MFQKILVYAAIISLGAALKKCDNKLCNHEAECVITRGKPTCKCIGTTFFTGDKCQDQVDNCLENPCQRGGQCFSHLGQFYCECPDTIFGGQKCNIAKGDLFRHAYLHFNRLAALQKSHTFLLALENAGGVPFTAELFTEDTFIDGFTYYPNDPKYEDRWNKSEDLVALARSLSLQHARYLPFKKGFYRVSKARFYIAGAKDVTLTFTNMDKELIYMQSFGMHIYKPNSLGCVPVIEVPLCSTPKPLLHMDVAQYNSVEPTVKKRCSRSSTITYKWSVKNFVGTVKLHSFKPVKNALLKIPPYRLWFDFRDDYVSSFLIYGEVEEVYGSERRLTYVRCYVYIDTKPVKAYITGGPERTVGLSQALILDASKSRNFAFAPKADQHLLYRWDCKALAGGESDACKSNIGNEKETKIPADQLILHQSYSFTLYIKSSTTFVSLTKYVQTVKVEDNFALLVDFECVRNCENNKFTPAQVVHLLAVCTDCVNSVDTITYAWTQNGNAVGDQQRLVFTPGNERELDIVLNITQGSGSGKVQLKLSSNDPPKDGDCKITPAAGDEYITEFEIACTDYTDDDLPLQYAYLADENTLERTGNPLLKLRLPKLNQLKVQICDAKRSCTEKLLSVSVTPLDVPSSVGGLQEFLKEDNFDLRTLLKDGKTRQALLLADVVLKEASSVEFANKIASQMDDYEVETLLAAEQFTGITKHLFESLQPMDNKKATVMAKFFEKLAEGYENVILDGEMRDLLKEPYELMANSLAYMLNEFSVPLEEIQEVQIVSEEQDLNNPLAEHYPDFPKFDITVLPRIENWLKAAVQLNKCIHRLGFLATSMHHPGEEPYVSELESFTMEMFGFEGGQTQEVQSKDGEVQIKLNNAVIAELQDQMGGRELVLQVVSIQTNPFWWYPDEQPLSTSVMYFSAFGQKKNLDSTIRLQNTFDFIINLRSTRPEKVSNSYLESSLDMPIFEVKMPANSVLVVKFRKTDINISVMLRLGVKPRGFMVRKSHQIVLVGREGERSFVLVNNKPEERTGYLAVMASKGQSVSSRAEFSFEFFLHECLSWDFSLPDPQWTTSGCIPSEQETTADKLYCRCHHLSSFSGKVFPTSAKAALGDRRLLESVPINWLMVLFYICLLLMFGLLIWSARRKMNEGQSEYLMIERTDRDDTEDFDIVLLIHTGSHRNAGTTANVDISLAMRWNVFKKCTIYQNPAKPKLTQNSTCVLKVPIASENLKKDPMKLIIQHDGFGRYPSWYCHSIEVKDLETKQAVLCPVAQWISTKPVHLEAPWEQAKVSRFSQFKEKLITRFINWFGFQAIWGPWKYGSEPFNRSERTMIWIIKVSLTICIIACYFGPTTLETYEEEREIYHHLSVGAGTVFVLSIVCYLIGVLVDVVLILLVKYDYI